MDQVKQEHTTNLLGLDVVSKTHPRIELRGRLDELNARILLLQVQARENKNDERAVKFETELEDVRDQIATLMSCEVRDIPCPELTLWGLSEQEIHERSHTPAKYYGLGHLLFHPDMGRWPAEINLLRALVRETELCACRAFDDGNGGVTRPDIIKNLNRLSSALYIMIYNYLPAGYDKVIVFGKRADELKKS